MLKETDIEEIILLFCYIFITGAIDMWDGGTRPLGHAYEPNAARNLMTSRNWAVANT